MRSQSIIVRTNEWCYLTKTKTKQPEMLDLRNKLINKELTVVEIQQNNIKKTNISNRFSFPTKVTHRERNEE